MNKIHDRLTRRQLLGVTLTAAAGISGATASAAEAPATAGFAKLNEKDPQAVALHYVHDAKLVDPKKSPTYKAGQHCANCLQITGKAGDAWRPCNIFPKKLVAADGWCSVWVQKPGTT